MGATIEAAVRGTDFEKSPEIVSDMEDALSEMDAYNSLHSQGALGVDHLSNIDQIVALGDSLDAQALALEIVYGDWTYPDRSALCAVAIRRVFDEVVDGTYFLEGGFSQTFQTS